MTTIYTLQVSLNYHDNNIQITSKFELP